MTSARAFGRLLWRPAAIIAVFPVFLASVWPGLLLADELDAGLSLWSSSAMARVLWGESVVLMAFLGILTSGIAKEAHQSVFAFSIPDLREKVLAGKLAVGTLFSLAIAVVTMAAVDPRLSVEAFACGLLFFALGSAVTDPLFPAIPGVATIAVLFISAAQPHRVKQIYDAAPVAAVIGSLVIFVVVAMRERSASLARRRVLLPALPSFASVGERLRNIYVTNVDDVLWTASPRSAGFRDWVRSANFELFGMRRFGWVVLFLGGVVTNCGIAYGLNNPGMAGLFGVMNVTFRGRRLTGQWPYPLSRKRRARLQFTLNLIDTLSYAALATALYWILDKSHIPRIPTFSIDGAKLRGAAIIPTAAIWYPLTQWLFLTGSQPVEKRMKSPAFQLKFGISFLIAAALATTSYELLQRLSRTASPSAAAAAGLVLALVVQLGYWRFVQHYFNRRDLI